MTQAIDNSLLTAIRKGGSVPNKQKEKSAEEHYQLYNEIITCSVRMPKWVLKRINDILEHKNNARVSKSSRNSWMLDALVEYMNTEESALFGDRSKK